MKRKVLLCAVLSVCTVFVGCRPIKTAKEITDIASKEIKRASLPSVREIDESGTAVSKQVMELISEKDTEALHEMFCSALKDEISDTQIKQLIEMICGNITSYEEPNLYGLGIHYLYDLRKQGAVRFDIMDINTDSSGNYSLNIVLNVDTGENLDSAGINCIALYDGDMFDGGTKLYEIGRVIENYTPVKVPDKCMDIDREALVSSVLNEQFGSNILYYLNNNDKDSFVELFPETERNTASEKYDEIIKMINGRLVSYSCFHTEADDREYAYDHYEKRGGRINIYDILNEKGEKFELEVKVLYTDLKSPGDEGIRRLAFKRVDNESDSDFNHKVLSEINFDLERGEE